MFLLFDIGGTKTRLAVVSPKTTKISPEEVVIFPTPTLFNHGIEQIVDTALRLAKGNKIKSGGGGIGALLDKSKTSIINYSNKPTLIDWNHKPIKKELEKKLNCKIYLENDAALCGLGEAIFGAGRKSSLIAYLTIGTGVGGVKIENGAIDQNYFGFEPGKQLLEIGTNQISTLEVLIGGRFIKEKFQILPSDIQDSVFWQNIEYYLSIGLHNAALFWSPEKIVLGGSIINYLSLDRIKVQFERLLANFPQKPLIEKAILGELSGLYGALHYLKNSVNSKQ